MSPRNLTIALFISLAFNVFAFGAVVGALVIGVRMTEGRQMAMRPGLPPIFAAAESLPDARQDAYRRALRAEAGEARRTLMLAGQARREAWGRLSEDPYDPAAVRRDLVAAQAIEAQARSGLESRIVTFAEGLTLEERQALAAALSRPPRRHRDGGGDREDRPLQP